MPATLTSPFSQQYRKCIKFIFNSVLQNGFQDAISKTQRTNFNSNKYFLLFLLNEVHFKKKGKETT